MSLLSLIPLLIALLLGVALAIGYINLLLLHPRQTLDRSSAANLNEIRTTFLSLDLTIDFAQKKLVGSVIHNFTAITDHVSLINLDVEGITVSSAKDLTNNIALSFRVDEWEWLIDDVNQVLTIYLKHSLMRGQNVQVMIEYSTSPTGKALNWLNENQTSTKQPFFYTAGETHYSRSVMPVQDTPAIKFPYSAKLRVQEPLIALASGLPKHKAGITLEGNYREFEYYQEHPVPAYLVAIVAGVLERREIDYRTYLYAEPHIANRSAEVLSDLGEFLNIIEAELVPYPWKYYGVVVMPFGYGLGGMENPLITFLNPSIITSGKESEDVAAHELAHSWFGNLVTCKNWTHTWLNEGLTMFGERSIMEKFFGRDFYEASATIGLHYLEQRVQWFNGSEQSKLVCYSGRINPGYCFTLLEYEKGFAFARNLEALTGSHNFYTFLRKYLSTYQFKSAESDDFKTVFEEFARTQLPNGTEVLRRINWTEEFRGSGIPQPVPDYHNPKIEDAKKLANEYIAANGTSPDNPQRYHAYFSLIKIIFMLELTKLHAPVQVLKQMDTDLNVTDSENNPEILLYWLTLNIPKRLPDVKQKVEKYVSSYGRGKYVLATYRALARTDIEFGRMLFAKYGQCYHAGTAKAIADILK